MSEADKASVDAVVAPSWWNQLHDPKEGRPIRDIPYTGTCGQCGEWDGHKLDCPAVDMEQLAKMVLRAQRQEEDAKIQAKRYWEHVQRAIGRVAVLRHENNKLRKKIGKMAAASDEAPIGWKVIDVGSNGSVLCESPSGRRIRYTFLGRPTESQHEIRVADSRS